MPEPLVISLAGEYDIYSRDELAAVLGPAADAAVAIVDMSAVSYADSTALNELVRTHKRRIAKGLEPARLVVPGAGLRRLFAVTHLDRLWPLYETLDAARHPSRFRMGIAAPCESSRSPQRR